MKAIYTWLSSRRPINFLLVCIYFPLVVLPHEQFGLFVSSIFKSLGRDTYNFVILVIGLVGLSMVLLPALKTIKEGQNRGWKLFYLLSTVLFIVLAVKLLVIINIEFIHFLQYAILAILLFPLTGRYLDTLFWATLLGMVDEAYQYFYLAPLRTNYYDFNDVIINLLGAALALAWLRTYDLGKINQPRKKWYLSLPVVILGLIGMVLTYIIKKDILFLYPPSDGSEAPILLVRKVTEGFWTTLTGVRYHIVQPIEGLILLFVLFLFYAPMSYYPFFNKVATQQPKFS